MTIQRIFPATDGPAAPVTDAAKYSLGVEFYTTKDTQLTAFYYWMSNASQSHAARTFRLYQCLGGDNGAFVAGSEVAASAYSDGAWNRYPLSNPPVLSANQHYRAVVFCDAANAYCGTNDFWTADITNGFLVAPSAANAVATDQGSFVVSAAIAYPFESFSSGNYWIDVEVNDAVDASQQGGALNSHFIIAQGII